MNPLEFEKDLLINLNQTPAPEPTAAMVERLLHREPDDPSDIVAEYIYSTKLKDQATLKIGVVWLIFTNVR